MIEKLQYISSAAGRFTELENIERNCREGVSWVQLRMKGLDAADLLPHANTAREICDKYGAILIINDHPEVAREARADGVHLGKADMPPSEARSIVGEEMIIGGTANTFEDILYLAGEGVGYIGLGPFRFTSTKQNLSPVLGEEGYVMVLRQCQEQGIQIPVIAIGGIRPDDIPGLIQAGVQGVAVSGILSGNGERKTTIQQIKNHLEKHQSTLSC